MKVLHVSAGPRADSQSRTISGQLVSTLCRLDHTVWCLERDLTAHPVPHITRAWTEISDNLLAEFRAVHNASLQRALRGADELAQALHGLRRTG